MLDRFDPLLYVLDKGRGMEMFIRLMGGAYVHLEKGKPTGWAPFELADTAENREFLYGVVELCGRKNRLRPRRAGQSRADLKAGGEDPVPQRRRCGDGHRGRSAAPFQPAAGQHSGRR